MTTRPLSSVMPQVGKSIKVSAADSEFADNSLERGVIAKDLVQVHALDLFADVRQPTGLVLTATPADGVFATLVSSHVRLLVSNTADANTKTAVGHAQYCLPDNYVDGAAITIRLSTKLRAAGGDTIASNNGSDIDCSVYKQAAGAVGSDLVTTAAQTPYVAADTNYDVDFVVTPTGLVPGDMLNIEFTTRAIETGSEGGTLQSAVTRVAVVHDVQG